MVLCKHAETSHEFLDASGIRRELNTPDAVSSTAATLGGVRGESSEGASADGALGKALPFFAHSMPF